MKRSEKRQRDEELRANVRAIVLDFDAKYPTEEHYAERIASCMADNFNSCRHCQSENVVRRDDGRSLYCNSCHETVWLTAQTFFHGTNDLRRYLIAIDLRENNIVINSKMFSEIVGVSYDSAWNISLKLDIVAERSMEESASVAPSSQFNPLFTRRSRETPARSSPIAEQNEIDDEHEAGPAPSEDETDGNDWAPSSQHSNQETKDSFETLKEHIFSLLSTTQPVTTDSLCVTTGEEVGRVGAALTMLKLEGKVVDIPGDAHIRSRSSTLQLVGDTESLQKLIQGFIEFAKDRFQGIARKYLQLYLACFWCHVDKKRWGPDSLLRLCVLSPSISRGEILRYVSPRNVFLPSAA